MMKQILGKEGIVVVLERIVQNSLWTLNRCLKGK